MLVIKSTDKGLGNISEEYFTARMYLDVAQGVELASKEVIQKDGDVVRRGGIDEHHARWQLAAALVYDDEVSLVRSSSAVRHLQGVVKFQLLARCHDQRQVEKETQV